MRKRIGNDSEDEKRPGGRKKRSMVIHTIWDARGAMNTLLNEVRCGEWTDGAAREQRCCIEAIADMIRASEVEEKIANLEALIKQAQAGAMIPRRRI